MKAPVFFLFLTICAISRPECPPQVLDVYSRLTSNLWGVESLRKNLYTSLSESRSTANQETYYAATAIMDGLRRRHIDIYPILSNLPDLRKLQPQDQLIRTLEILSNENRINYVAATQVINALKQHQVQNQMDLTTELDNVQTVLDNKPISFIFNLIRDRIKSCQPDQNLIGAILMNTPLRSAVLQSSYEVSQSLHDAKLPQHVWDTTLQNIPIDDENLTNWLAKVVNAIAALTNNHDLVQAIAHGILKFEDHDLIGPNSSQEETGPDRWRRSSENQLEPNLRTLSEAIAKYTLSLIRQKREFSNPIPKPIPKPMFLSANAMINQIHGKIVKQAEKALASSEENSSEINIALVMARSASPNNTQVNENSDSDEGK